MIKLLFLMLFSLSVFAEIKVEMDFSETTFSQGQLVRSKLQIAPSGQLNLSMFKGQTIGKTVHFYDVGPIIKRENTNTFEADARVIFIKVPEGHQIQETIGTEPVTINWGAIKVLPTQESPQLLFGTFEVPARVRWVAWLIIILCSSISIGCAVWIILRKVNKKKLEKRRFLDLKNEILGCRNYEDVVALWKRKHILMKEFPHVREPFLAMEETLNKHQFKPRQSEAEKIEVVESYRKFTRSVEGGFLGI